MKIVHVHKYFYLRRGAERYMLGLMRLQRDAGHEVFPFSMTYRKNIKNPWSNFFVSELDTEHVGKGIGAVRQTLRAFWSLEARRKFSSFLDTVKPDVVHIHNIYTHISPSILGACKKRGIPVVMTVHDHGLISANYALWDGQKPMDPKTLSIWKVAKTGYIKNSYLATFGLELVVRLQRVLGMYDRYIDRYIAVSNYMKKSLVAAGYPKEKIEVLYNFADVAFRPARKKINKNIVFVGSLENNKGVATLIEAIRSFKDAKLFIAGTGSDEKELRERAQGMKQVKFLGFVAGTELEDLVASSRVAVVPSIWNEPFGLVAVEAMALGTPVIVSDRGGLPEIVESGISGEIFKAGNVESLRKALSNVLEDDDYAGDLAKDAYKRAKEIADPQKHLKAVMGIYKELMP
ncbi:MAG: glycosyltransferase family 4 protein [Patescibacteria group bacterium]|jgi:glycosyltransferase involved in cell wall biosynthesis